MDRFIDDFARIMRYVPPDPAHRYTVGEHSLKIIEYLEELRSARKAKAESVSPNSWPSARTLTSSAWRR